MSVRTPTIQELREAIDPRLRKCVRCGKPGYPNRRRVLMCCHCEFFTRPK